MILGLKPETMDVLLLGLVLVAIGLALMALFKD